MRSLRGLLLRLTAAFAALALMTILLLSLGRACQGWLEARLNSAHLAALTVEASGSDMLDPTLQDQVLKLAGVELVSLRTPGRRTLPLARDGRELHVGTTIDLGRFSLPRAVVMSLRLLLGHDESLLRVFGVSASDPATIVDLVMRRQPLVAALKAATARIVITGTAVTLAASLLLFLALEVTLVRPMRVLTESIRRFARDPEGPLPEPKVRRDDEIGGAMAAIGAMQASIQQDLWRKSRLAALGTAMAKVNHDLRGVLATALLVSDRLSGSSDPKVRNAAPLLLGAIERAVALCSRTMEFVREGPPTLTMTHFALRELVLEAGAAARAAAGTEAGRAAITVDAPGDLALTADRELLFRVFMNLARNAIEAGATAVTTTASAHDGLVEIDLADDGPGLPAALEADPFRPFHSGRRGGSGLGLSIARDLVRAHGGEIRLAGTGPSGTRFHLSLPQQPGPDAGEDDQAGIPRPAPISAT